MIKGLLVLIGVALIVLGFTDFIVEDMKIYIIGGGFVLILLVILWLWWGRRKRKMEFAAPKGVGRFRIPQYRAVTPESRKAYGRKMAREKREIEKANVIPGGMRAVNPKGFKEGVA